LLRKRHVPALPASNRSLCSLSNVGFADVDRLRRQWRTACASYVGSADVKCSLLNVGSAAVNDVPQAQLTRTQCAYDAGEASN
jgi:hypothetical protein